MLLPLLTTKMKFKDLYLMTDIFQEKKFIICSVADTDLNKDWSFICSSSVFMNPINLEDEEVKDSHHFSSLVWIISFG